jgi:hypothetical protein
LESLAAQDWQGWGLVLIDDASTNTSCPAYQQLLLDTVVPVELRNRVRLSAFVPTLHNTVAVHYIASDYITLHAPLKEE